MIDINSVGKKAIVYATPIPQGYGPELAQGKIIGYVDKPMVLIEDDKGKQFWWLANQTEVIEDGK